MTDLTVLKVTRWCADAKGGHDVIGRGPPVFVIATEDIHQMWSVEYSTDDKRTLGWLCAREGDEFTAVPMDEWPDEVCVAMAKQALLGKGEN